MLFEGKLVGVFGVPVGNRTQNTDLGGPGYLRLTTRTCYIFREDFFEDGKKEEYGLFQFYSNVNVAF